MKLLVKHLRKIIYLVSSLIIFSIVTTYLIWITFPHQVVAKTPFTEQNINLNTFNYYDLGTVDINKDGLLDIFTTNHSSIQSLLLASGNGTYTDQLVQYGLNQVKKLPNLENAEAAPDTSAPGLHIFYHHDILHLIYTASPSVKPATGHITSLTKIKVINNENFQVEVNNSSEKSPASIVKFSAIEKSNLSLAVSVSTPITITLKNNIPLKQVFIGSDQINPNDHEFELYLKDRHGIAWSDFNNDDKLDAYISRGGLSGLIANFPGELSDQFFISTEDKYNDKITNLGFEKRRCPARQVAWVDANTDGRLDLYIACGRQVGGFWEYIPTAFKTGRGATPNMLFIQSTDGTFDEAAHKYGLDFSIGGTFLWFDVDTDGDSDLLWASEDEVAIYKNSNGKFIHETLLPNSTTTQIRKLTASDFDMDGDIDVYAAASFGSKLIINNAGNLTVVNPKEYGLPSSARTASWVDYNNDSRMDLYTWPGGIFQQEEPGEFKQTELLRINFPFWFLIDPRVLLFDYDNDGDRDAIIMQRFFPRAIQELFPQAMSFTEDFLRNDSTTKNNWFEIELQGLAGNLEAIGTTVSVTTSTGIQTAEVGQSENSHYSQGHYRLYFGLGKDHEPKKIEIRWPGNFLQQVEIPVNNRIIKVKQKAVSNIN